MEDNSLDIILKKQLQNYAPEPPSGVWSGIEKAANNAAGNSGNIFSSIKNLGWFGKTVAVLVVPAAVALTYFATKQTENATKTEQNISASQVKPEPIIDIQKTSIQTETILIKPKVKSKIKAAEIKSTPINLVENVASISTTIDAAKIDFTKVAIDNVIHSAAKIEVAPKAVKHNSNVVPSNNTAIQKPVSDNQLQDDAVVLTNAFSPDNDGLNDKYIVKIENEKLFHLSIYNFKNELIFETDDKNEGWDGNYKNGLPCEVGMYAVTVVYQLNNQQEVRTKNRGLNLLR